MVRTRVLALTVAAATVLGAAPARAASCAGLPKHGSFPVVDTANVVAPEAEAWLIADLVRYHVSGHEAIVTATVADLDGDDISAYATRLFDCWGVGDDTTDNGILVLVAMAERRVRIEVGAGLDGELTQRQLENAIATMRTPMRRGDVGAGLRAAVVSVVGALGNEFPDTQNGKDGSAAGVPVAIPSTDPGDVEDTTSGDPSDDLPPNVLRDVGSPFGGDEPGGGAFGFVPVLVVLGIVFTVGRALVSRISGAMGGGRSAWAGFGAGGARGWVAPPAVFRNGSWQSPPDTGPSAGFGGSDFGSSGGSSGGSFGGGSSGGGGASGSW